MKCIKFSFSFLIVLLSLISCLKNEKQSPNVYFSEEKFVDSLNIGIKGKTKVEIEKFRNEQMEDNLVVLTFFKKDSIWSYEKQKVTGTLWRQTNKFYFEKDEITGINSELKDFNNDGFKDFTYQSGIAGRGGNEIRTLFIYNPKERNFIHIKNSDNYPNLSYNSKLNCVNSIILTGSTTTAFLKIEKDSLNEFARVDVSDTIVVSEKDTLGKFKIIEKKKFTGNDEDFYQGYSNYKPLEY
jgi:hypothetical protein